MRCANGDTGDGGGAKLADMMRREGGKALPITRHAYDAISSSKICLIFIF